MSTPADTATATAFTVMQTLTPGLRVRVTWPNGVRRVGVVGRMRFGPNEVYAILDGLLVDGGYTNAARVEVMGSNGRYAPRWTAESG